MATELRDQLQATLGQAYTLERELGGGGMSRVFVAREHSLGRRVVVKVLPPELAAGVNVERFKREISFAAQLQHPHILPVLSAGETDGLPYYTMPFVEGESLRARLTSGTPCSHAEIVHVLSDVAKALAHAHARGVVHRDIKPDNVLLSGGAAVVTDFGVAKALSSAQAAAARPADATLLTGVGMAIGTPAYMAPEQAAADPDADHRVDIYAFGVMAYELVGGRLPFTGRSMQSLLAAHLSEPPMPVEELRADVPYSLAALIMGCLEKDPAHRPQTAAELVQRLEAVSVGSGPADASARTGPVAPARTLAGFVLGAAAVVLLARAAVVVLALPDWIVTGTLIVLALGFPPLLVAVLLQRRPRRTTVTTPGGSRYTPTLSGETAPRSWLTAPRAASLAGGLVLAWGALVGAIVLLGAVGLGPARSLLTAGVLEERARLLLADFTVTGGDTLLGMVATEAIRTDLSQSSAVTLVPASTVRGGMARMQRQPGTRLDSALAHDLAQRDGIPAFITGDIVAVAGSYALTARLISTETGDELTSARASAAGDEQLLPALDQLSKELRARIGESMRDVRETPALAQVTTGSLDALRKYALAVRLIDGEGDYARGMPLLEEAIAADTAFAMAYRKLAISLQNLNSQFERSHALLTRAYQHRDRLTPVEARLTAGSYFGSGPAFDRERAIAAYESVLELDPQNSTALNNLAGQYSASGDAARAEALYRRAVAAEPDRASAHFNLINAQVTLGRIDSAAATFRRVRERFPRHRLVHTHESLLAYYQAGPDSMEAVLRRQLAMDDLPPDVRVNNLQLLGNVALLHGRFAEGERISRQAVEANRQRGEPEVALAEEVGRAFVDAWYRDDAPLAVRRLDAALRRNPLDSYPLLRRPYLALTVTLAVAGEPARARQVYAQYEAAMAGDTALRRLQEPEALGAQAEIALAEGRAADALALVRRVHYPSCPECTRPDLARALEAAGQPDSAIAMYEAHLADRYSLGRLRLDAVYLPIIRKRLGELYEARGDRARAAEQYQHFVELWSGGDPEARERVAEVRRRLERLRGS